MLLSLLLVYGGTCLLPYLVSGGMIFQPPPATYEDTSRTLKLSSADGARI